MIDQKKEISQEIESRKGIITNHKEVPKDLKANQVSDQEAKNTKTITMMSVRTIDLAVEVKENQIEDLKVRAKITNVRD